MLTKTVTRVFPTENKAGLKLVLTDTDRVTEEQTVISKNYMVGYNPSDGLTGAMRNEIEARMQADIDRYKVLAGVYAVAGFVAAPGVVSGNLNIS